MNPGIYGGTITAWKPPFIPVYFNPLAAMDIPQGPPQISLPVNVDLITTLLFLVVFNVAGLVWAKMRVHRRGVLRERMITAKVRVRVRAGVRARDSVRLGFGLGKG